MFERLAIEVLRECSITGATQMLGLSWDEAWHLMERAVARGQARKTPEVIPHLGIDEKAIAKGQRDLTLVCHLAAGTVEYAGAERKPASLEAYSQTLPAEKTEAFL